MILTESSTLRVFADPALTTDYTDCVNLWRRVSTRQQTLTCAVVTFAVSTEFYNGTLSEFLVVHFEGIV